MKLLFPVTGVIFLSGMCCCGDFMEGMQTGMDAGMQAAEAEGVSAEKKDDAAPSAAPSSGATVSALGGTCGRYKDWGIGAPDGWSTVACSDDGSSGGLVLQGGSDPVAACKSLKGWAEGKGFKVSMDTEMAGTVAVILEKDSTQMTLSCSSMGGQNNVAVALSPK